MSADFFVLRTPLLSVETLERFYGEGDGRQGLLELAADPQIEAALALASSSLQAGLGEWREDPQGPQTRSAERSLVRYVARMCTRPALFGAFAAYTLGEFSDTATALTLSDRAQLVLRTVPDAAALQGALDAALDDAADELDLLLCRDPGVYEVAGQLRLAARRPGGERFDRRRIVAFAPTEAARAALEAAAQPVTRGALEEIAGRQVVARLMRNGALAPAAVLPVTGESANAQARAALQSIPGAGPLTPTEHAHVNAVRPAVAKLSPRVMRELERAVTLLSRVAPAGEAPALTRFRDDFEQRYGTRAVPLLEALDPDCGVALHDHEPGALSLPPPILLELIERGRDSGEVELTQDDVEALAAEGTRLAPPDAYALSATIEARDVTAVDQGRFSVIEPKLTGPSGVRMLARLCEGDPRLTERVRAHLRAEEACRPDLLFAELVSAPDTRWGLSMSRRPVLREWEIECGGRSGAQPQRRLEASDLMLSLERGELVVYSQQLERRLAVRASTAMNHQWVSLPAVRLLRLLEAQHRVGLLRWSWGGAAAAPQLPRVRHGRIVLSRRRWTLPLAGIEELEDWRMRHDVPARVAVLGPKGELVVDLRSALGADAFRAAVRGGDRAQLVEIARESPVEGPDGHYAHELIVPFVGAPKAALPDPPRAAVDLTQRRFAPGSEWFYAKLYGPTSAAEEVLVEVVDALAPQDWFFVRYGDPDWHVRLRMRGDAALLLGELHAATADPLADGRLHRVALDTYEREIERYGGLRNVELMEQMAHADSVAILALGGSRPRWLLALASVAALLVDAGLELAEREQLCRDALRYRAPEGAPWLARQARADRPVVAQTMSGSAELFAQRSEVLRPVVGELLPVLDVVAHMHVNRALLRSGGAEEVRVYDALARAYRTARLRGG